MDEVRIPARLLCDRLCECLALGNVAIEQRQREIARLPVRELAEVDRARLHFDLLDHGEEKHSERARFGLLGAIRADEQQARLVGRSQQAGQERRAVCVGPMKVVDEDRDRPSRATLPRSSRNAKAARLRTSADLGSRPAARALRRRELAGVRGTIE